MARSVSSWQAGAICALFLLNACIGSLDGNDATEYPVPADEAYEGESDSVLDLIQTGESAAPPLKKEVKIVGDTSILATLRTFGEGGDLLSIADKSTGFGMAFGTNSGQQDHMRLKPIKGPGIAINSAKDAVGVYVDAETGQVGIGHTNIIKSAPGKPGPQLHVKGTTYSSGTITTNAALVTGGLKASLQLTGVSDYHGIQFGKDGNDLYVIGRGKSIEDREMSFHIPAVGDYEGGAAPKFRWVSGNAHTTLAELEAGTGNMYVKGRLGIGAMTPKSALDVRGGINIQNAKGEAVITFPKGEGSAFFIRSTDSPDQATDEDTNFYISGTNGFVGLSTTSPKSMLDVRGAVNLQDATGAAVIYFPEKGKAANLFIRCTDDPSKYEPAQERLFIGGDGRVGIGTIKPSYGLELNNEAAPAGSKLHDVLISKGNLHLGGSIFCHNCDKKYKIDLQKDSFLKRATVETSLGIGTSEPVGVAEGAAVVHVADPASPLVRIENTKAEGSASLELKAGDSVWSAQGSTAGFKIQHNGESQLTVTPDGKIGIGGTQEITHGLTLNGEWPVGHTNNDLAIRKGNLWLGGAINQVGDSKYSLSLANGGFIKRLNVEKNLGIGLGEKKPEFDLELGAGKVISFGNQMFLSGESGVGYVSSNLYRKENKWNLYKSAAGGALISLKSSGAVEISGTPKPGDAKLQVMMSVNAVTQTAVFPMEGVKFGVGTSSPEYPVHVIGSGKIGVEGAEASIAFGQSEASMGFLSANAQYVAMGNKNGQEVLALDQSNGYVGVGTTSPQAPLHVANAKEAGISFGSSQALGTQAYIKATPSEDGINMVMGVKSPLKGSSKLTFDFKNTVTFAGTGNTVFARGDTLFKTGSVGIGATPDPKFKLHVQGDTMIEGRCFVSKKRVSAKKEAPPEDGKKPEPKPEEDVDFLDHLDFTDLLEEDEVSQDNSRERLDLVDTLSSLSKVIRKQLTQMGEHDSKIQSLTSQLETLSKA